MTDPVKATAASEEKCCENCDASLTGNARHTICDNPGCFCHSKALVERAKRLRAIEEARREHAMKNWLCSHGENGDRLDGFNEALALVEGEIDRRGQKHDYKFRSAGTFGRILHGSARDTLSDLKAFITNQRKGE